MARGLEKGVFIGHLGADPEMRYTAGGTPVTNFRIAVTRSTGSGEGRKDVTDWWRCTAWNKLGEIANQYLRKGSKVYLEGRLENDNFERDGKTEYRTIVQVTDIVMLSTRREDDGGTIDAEEDGARLVAAGQVNGRDELIDMPF